MTDAQNRWDRRRRRRCGIAHFVLVVLCCSSTLMMSRAAAAPDNEPELRTEAMFDAWASQRAGEIKSFRDFLESRGIADVYPLYQLARTASAWKSCGGPAFELPPRAQWPEVESTLLLASRLLSQDVMRRGEVVSAYRNPALNACAGGSARSAHATGFALDILGIGADAEKLCEFHRKEGAHFKMGLSRYASGRIHIDTHGYRTWGNSHGASSSFCVR